MFTRLFQPHNQHAQIISYADSNHYLLSLQTDEGRHELVYKDSKPLIFNGLSEAKDWLGRRGFKEAEFRMDTPYDEFSGSTDEPSYITIPIQ